MLPSLPMDISSLIILCSNLFHLNNRTNLEYERKSKHRCSYPIGLSCVSWISWCCSCIVYYTSFFATILTSIITTILASTHTTVITTVLTSIITWVLWCKHSYRGSCYSIETATKLTFIDDSNVGISIINLDNSLNSLLSFIQKIFN